MNAELTPNTQAALLLTAPLMTGPREEQENLLTPGEYQRIERRLAEAGCFPGDMLTSDRESVVKECAGIVDEERLVRLLSRGFQLSQALERWGSRAIWVVGRNDEMYPARLKTLLGEKAPVLLYGCGDLSLLEDDALAVVGSRDVSEELLAYTERIGTLAAMAGITVVSGAARGIDQAAMRGALENDGRVTGVLSGSLEQTCMHREHRNMVMSGRLTLVSPFDPLAGFSVGNAMQRNKVIYGLANIALVVSSDLNKGGTWAGAVEQLEKFKCVPLYVRATGTPQPGLEALRKKGALAWPEPEDAASLLKSVRHAIPPAPQYKQAQQEFLFVLREDAPPKGPA